MGDLKLTVESTRSRAVFGHASELYTRVFGYTAADHSLNPKLLSAIVGNGGAAVAARDGAGELVGFAYGFVGFESGAPYLYSQAAFIDPAWQGKGVGRLLKQEQAIIARSEGLTSMRWAFDPTLARNAHFNLDVLGARGVRFAANYYDEPFSDRLIVDWSLASAAIGSATPPRAAAPIPPSFPVVDPTALGTTLPRHWGRPVGDGDVIHVPIPSDTPAKTLAPAIVQALRAAVAETFTDLFERGYVAESCVRVDGTSAAYVFVAAGTQEAAPRIHQAAR
ncbi:MULTISPECIES: GNAT family N-acetyltransferase [unclassified Cryobacterium]|uniref:GNAT family N-acetyltransferase n=1 Tax=unclassified Cryobacterium TaxID=2649013 RepID=UPI002AB46354|nr:MULTISPECIES: GNAT family N-acetyltransferase [unclassified Cryobacterium]MDY7541286.1 GNAT family N-acetyltransferase [Cryobacterium sp. 5B3]MEA9998086.1 GNAT family N-acetyltransferase [Cryobacterium sp. RTS3]MEB0266544.1 GNAT family N-acetyltransferase [Cryobacterium sp. 10I5]MEB0273415.1 GNAT family N-acetyltransferase [Cryobacterium sp. 5B3]